MIRIIAPKYSFVQFAQAAYVGNERFSRLEVLPVVEDNDIAFQFILQGDTSAELDTLCHDRGGLVTIGLALHNEPSTSDVLTFEELPERFRLDDLNVLYNWPHGLTGFGAAVDYDECFFITVRVNPDEVFFSNYFKRVLNDKYTAVVDFTNNENFAGFNYCGGISVDESTVDCTPTEIAFTNETSLSIPYITSYVAKYGNVPTVQIWLYDDGGILINTGLRATLDGFPPTYIKIDFGGIASGIVKIS